MTKSELGKEFQQRFLELRQILNSWDLIPGSPKDEFDSLNHKILSHLYKGADLEKISRVIEGELTVNYGIYTDKGNIEKIATEIFGWWDSNEKMHYGF